MPIFDLENLLNSGKQKKSIQTGLPAISAIPSGDIPPKDDKNSKNSRNSRGAHVERVFSVIPKDDAGVLLKPEVPPAIPAHPKTCPQCGDWIFWKSPDGDIWRCAICDDLLGLRSTFPKPEIPVANTPLTDGGEQSRSEVPTATSAIPATPGPCPTCGSHYLWQLHDDDQWQCGTCEKPDPFASTLTLSGATETREINPSLELITCGRCVNYRPDPAGYDGIGECGLGDDHLNDRDVVIEAKDHARIVVPKIPIGPPLYPGARRYCGRYQSNDELQESRPETTQDGDIGITSLRLYQMIKTVCEGLRITPDELLAQLEPGDIQGILSGNLSPEGLRMVTQAIEVMGD